LSFKTTKKYANRISRWYVTLRNGVYVDLVHHSRFEITPKHDFYEIGYQFPTSGKEGDTLLSPLGRTNLNHRKNMRIIKCAKGLEDILAV
jgi:hypothetical protein